MKNWVKIMETRQFRWLPAILVLCLLLGLSRGGWAEQVRTITLEEALNLAFKQNTSHTLFLREQEFLEKREELAHRPQITTEIKPITIQDGVWEKPQGSLDVTMPVAQNLDLSSKVTIEFGKSGVEAKPSGSLALNYRLFALPEKADGGLSAEETMRNQANSLILQTADLLIQLRQKLDLMDYEEGRLRYLEASLDAARFTPNYDDLKLKKELRDQATKLAAMQEELEQLQLKVATMLGIPETMVYVPIIRIGDLNFSFVEEDLREELFSSSASVRQAQAELTLAQNRLVMERETGGWDLKVTGGISASESWSWYGGVTASKTLYPRHIVLEELEFEVAKAEYAMERQESALNSELKGALQAVQSAQNHVELKAEHLGEAQDDRGLRQRQFEAGLVTELQVQEAQLALEKAELDYAHGQILHAQSVLDLWNLCGRDLQALVFEVIN